MSTPAERLWSALKLRATSKGTPFNIIDIEGEIDSPLNVEGFPISCKEVLDVIESVSLYIPDWMTEKFYKEWSLAAKEEGVCQFIYSKLEDPSCFRDLQPPLDILKDLGWKYLYAPLIKTETYHQNERQIGDEGATLITMPFFPEATMSQKVYQLIYSQFTLIFDIVRGQELLVTRLPPCTVETQNVYWRAFFDAFSSLDSKPLIKVEEYERPEEEYKYIPEFLFWENVHNSVKSMYPQIGTFEGAPKFILTFTSPTGMVSGQAGGKFNETSTREEYSEEILAQNGTSSLAYLTPFPSIKYYQPRYAPGDILDTSGNRVPFPSFRSQDYIEYQPLPQAQKGLYPPVNLLEPTEEDKNNLLSFLLFLGKKGVKFNLGDSEKVHRRHLLLKINDLVKRITGDKKSIVLPFGSYVLGVDLPGSDMDLLCVIAKDIDIQNTFDALEARLRQEPTLGTLFLIPKATVPTIKFSIEGVDVDLIFSKLSLELVPELKELESDDVLQGMEEASIRALNGYRVAQKIMELVPNLENWRIALKFIKLWAKVRGIYGNSFGYMGGVAYALLTAFISQLYPKALPSALVRKFFFVLHKWSWNRPIQLNELQTIADIQVQRPSPLPSPEFMVWKPNKGANIMPIITPAFPAMNASYNINSSTFYVIKSELDRGDILFHQNRDDYSDVWEELVAKSDFFERYPYYLEILLVAPDQATLDLWQGYVESRISKISISLDTTLTQVEGISPPLPFSFNTSDYYTQYPVSSSYFIGIDYSRQQEVSISISYVVEEFNERLKAWEGKTEGMLMRMKLFKKRELPGYIKP